MSIKVQGVTVIDTARNANDLIQIQITNSSGNNVTLLANSQMSSNITFTLPSSIRSSNSFITSDGSGNTFSAPPFTVGMVSVMAGTPTAPDDTWLKCDGTAYPKNSYLELANNLGSLISNNIATLTKQTTNILRAITYGNNVYVSAGDAGELYSSTNGINWTGRSSGTTRGIQALIYGNGLYVYSSNNPNVGGGGGIGYSTNAINWTLTTLPSTSTVLALTYGNGIYVGGGQGGVIYSSTNAINWTSRTSGTTSTINALVYGNGLYVYAGVASGGLQATLATSTDAINWTPRTIPSINNLLTVEYGNGLYIYGGVNRVFGTSTDAINWTAATYPPIATNQDIRGIKYENGIYVIVASNVANNVSYSLDLNYWRPVITSSLITGNTMYSVAYSTQANGSFVFCGQQGHIGKVSFYEYNTTSDFLIPNLTSPFTFNNPSFSQTVYMKAK